MNEENRQHTTNRNPVPILLSVWIPNPGSVGATDLPAKPPGPREWRALQFPFSEHKKGEFPRCVSSRGKSSKTHTITEITPYFENNVFRLSVNHGGASASDALAENVTVYEFGG